jgi:5'-nucleotidase
MKVLITNDDGIFAPALPSLVAFVQSFASEVTVIAPKVEQSGMSHAIDFTRPIEIKEVSIAPGAKCYSMDSTPADCVRFAILGMKEKFDLVISGINRGYNLGADIVYSGTAAAVFEAARLGVRGVALSTGFDDFAPAFASLPSLLTFFKSNRLLDAHGWFNVNLPQSEAKGIRITRQGGIYFTDEFKQPSPEIYEQFGEPARQTDLDPEADIIALNEGYISVTPLSPSRTDFSAIERLKKAGI